MKKIQKESMSKKVFFLTLLSKYFGALIPAICIISLVYFIGTSEFRWFEDYKEYSVNVCTRTFEHSYDTTIKGPKEIAWFVVCGNKQIGFNKYEIQNNNLPGVISTSQEDISANIKVKMKCYGESKCPRFRRTTCAREIINYGKICEIEKLRELNRGPEFFKLNPGYKEYLKIIGKI